jgi:hypothetical protein
MLGMWRNRGVQDVRVMLRVVVFVPADVGSLLCIDVSSIVVMELT